MNSLVLDKGAHPGRDDFRGGAPGKGRSGGLNRAALRTGTALTLLLALAGNAARAADQAPAAEQAADKGAGLEEIDVQTILVTANRRLENAQRVGTSIDVMTGGDLVDRNVQNVYDLQYLTPSLQVTPQFGSGQPAYQIRGVGFNDYASNNAPAVGIYVDEVAYPVPFASSGAMFDVSRVEVLRGPQGTLYGRNTTGGAINYIMNKPTKEMTAGVAVQYGSFDAVTSDAFVSGPLNNKLAFRVAGQVQEGGAWQHNRDTGEALGDADRQALRALLDYDSGSNLRVGLNFHWSRDRSDAAGTYLLSPLTALNAKYPSQYPVYPADTARDATGWGTTPQFASEIGISPTTKPFSHIDTVGTSVRADWDFESATLTDLASFDHATRQEYDNFDGSPRSTGDVYFDTRANVVANELRLTSTGDQDWHWVTGLYYANQVLHDRYATGYYELNGFDRNVTYGQTVNTGSAFGQVTYDLTDKLSLTGGLRLEYEKRELRDFGAFYVNNGVVTNPGNVVPYRDTDFLEPSGKAELQYRFTDDDMAYVSFSRGIKSGGFTAYNSNVAQTSTTPFKPETIFAYEIGNKLAVPEYHLRFNISAFYYDYRDQQVQSAVVNPLTGLVGSIINAPKSHLYGGEADFIWEPIKNLRINELLALAKGSFDEFSTIGTAVKVGGIYVGVPTNRVGETEFAPKFTSNGSVSYLWNLGDYGLTTDMSYSSRSTYNSIFGSLYNVAGYTLVDASVTLAPKDDRWSLKLFGKNIFDKRYDVTRNFFVAGNNIALAGKPATWGVRFSVTY
ncbi:TonB-dependent receptor [Nitrospirillum sp. BR 11163]|uniref:TonB-dependent receptor n=1 Tax=Nitrospirillum sp. BR 11163 TaxID=3104323 RepID=UPI002AFED063|nr:TonB-dependent receptor [Nitrospirillum sp. BR 11163]MEA1672745.1 TonB-dependent receptor [Nitrospirillum sp. BR 11163]